MNTLRGYICKCGVWSWKLCTFTKKIRSKSLKQTAGKSACTLATKHFAIHIQAVYSWIIMLQLLKTQFSSIGISWSPPTLLLISYDFSPSLLFLLTGIFSISCKKGASRFFTITSSKQPPRKKRKFLENCVLSDCK